MTPRCGSDGGGGAPAVGESNVSSKTIPSSRGEHVIRYLTMTRASERSYREQALKIYPWICGRCAREFTRANLRELTVHHRDHNHDNNPPDGSNWELLCLYCHDNEHQRQLEAGTGSNTPEGRSMATHSTCWTLKAPR